MRQALIILLWIGSQTLPAADLKLRRVVDLSGTWKFSIGDDRQWASPDYKDYNWEQIQVPAPWEDQGFGSYDGYAWYRVTIELRNLPDNNLYLMMGYIDDVDEVYLNGTLIGFNGSFPPNFYTAYNAKRVYHIPDHLLNKNGKNVIAIRVYDTVLDGGIIKGDIGIYANLNAPTSALSLEGIWQFREGDNPWWKEETFRPDLWDQVMVPGYWGSLKDKRIKGIAWYRRSFQLPDNLIGLDNLVLVIGAIDDYDETYLNGELIGSTNDELGFGVSTSWRKMRIYKIPRSLLHQDGENQLAIRVMDIGGNAGIYQSPITILPASALKKLLESI